MNATLRLIPACAVLALAVTTAPAVAQTVLLDFGNSESFRGASTPSPDVNGNYWTSVWSGAFYADMLASDGVATAIDFGFTTPGGTDSYNGPAGATDLPGINNFPSNSVYNAAALGDLGVDEAVYDFYTNSTFQIQNLEVGGAYDLTFFGSHKYNSNNTTTYTVYTDGTFTTPTTSTSLFIGMDADHNKDLVATLSGVSPQSDGILYVGFAGAGGGEGYLNAMSITRAVPEPATLTALAGALLLLATRRKPV